MFSNGNVQLGKGESFFFLDSNGLLHTCFFLFILLKVWYRDGASRSK